MLGRRIEDAYEDYQLMKAGLKYDEAGSDATLYSARDHEKVRLEVEALELKLLELIRERRMLASILHHDLPDSDSLDRIEKEVIQSMEQLDSITDFRSGRRAN